MLTFSTWSAQKAYLVVLAELLNCFLPIRSADCGQKTLLINFKQI
jgi:hypothetical protein